MRVLICGDREWRLPELVEGELRRLKEAHGLDLIVIHGAATGADTDAAKAAAKLGIDQIAFPANWVGRGKPAGPIRNKMMLDLGKPDLVIAFHRFLPNSKGTKNMVEIAEKAGVAVMVIDGTEVTDGAFQKPVGPRGHAANAA